MTDPTPDQLNALPPEAFWTEGRDKKAKALTIVKCDPTTKRRERVRRGEVALRELCLSVTTRVGNERIFHAQKALEVLDEEQALLRVENERLRAALTAAQAGLLALNQHHTDDHHGGHLNELDERVSEALLAFRAALARAGERERCVAAVENLSPAPTPDGVEDQISRDRE